LVTARGQREQCYWRMLKEILIGLGMLPSRYLWRNPFKIIEYEELLANVRIASSDVILDIGCGSGPQDVLLARKAARVIGIDTSVGEIARAKALAAIYARGRALEFRCTALERAGFPAQHFDKVVSFCVLEHIVNRDEVLGVVSRVLKPGGQLVMSVDSLATITDSRLIAKHRADHAVQTYFSPAELREMLESRGFRDVRIWPIFRSPYARRLFEAGIDREFRFNRYRKFGSLARLTFDERRYRHADRGMFLCATAVRPA
jgi:2-polyprenyl-3-methyl-5-hydroxy-6-metoxy-1,4-benzoquinol methylase